MCPTNNGQQSEMCYAEDNDGSFLGGPIMLADFGLAINMDNERPVTRAGTLDYMAPEVRIILMHQK